MRMELVDTQHVQEVANESKAGRVFTRSFEESHRQRFRYTAIWLSSDIEIEASDQIGYRY
jgi:hypothetical protein